MITAVSLNPCIDRLAELERFNYGALNRVVSGRYDAGGKGLTVALVASRLGVNAECIGLMYRDNARMFENRLLANGTSYEFVWCEGHCRTNVKLLDRATGGEVMMFRTAATCYYIANEGLSVIENAALMGVPVPKKLKGALEAMKEKDGEVKTEE